MLLYFHTSVTNARTPPPAAASLYCILTITAVAEPSNTGKRRTKGEVMARLKVELKEQPEYIMVSGVWWLVSGV